jgi:hypothetical protein
MTKSEKINPDVKEATPDEDENKMTPSQFSKLIDPQVKS